MTPTILSLSRRHVLGDLYHRCDAITDNIPVYLTNENEPTLLGNVDQSLGHFADAFSFHLESDDCKKLSSGQFAFSVSYELSDPKEKGSQSRVKVTSITLTPRKSYEKPAAKATATQD